MAGGGKDAAGPLSTVTGRKLGSAKVTISAAAGFSVGGTSAIAGIPPRMTFTGVQSVSGKVTSCTLPGFLSSTCLPVTTVARDLDLGEVLAAYPSEYPSSSASAAPVIVHAQLTHGIDPPTGTAIV